MGVHLPRQSRHYQRPFRRRHPISPPRIRDGGEKAGGSSRRGNVRRRRIHHQSSSLNFVFYLHAHPIAAWSGNLFSIPSIRVGSGSASSGSRAGRRYSPASVLLVGAEVGSQWSIIMASASPRSWPSERGRLGEEGYDWHVKRR